MCMVGKRDLSQDTSSLAKVALKMFRLCKSFNKHYFTGTELSAKATKRDERRLLPCRRLIQ